MLVTGTRVVMRRWRRRPGTPGYLPDLQEFVSWLAGQLGVTDGLQPRDVRVRSHQVKIDSDEEGKAEPFLNSVLTPGPEGSRPRRGRQHHRTGTR
jgi:hypothetical protein